MRHKGLGKETHQRVTDQSPRRQDALTDAVRRQEAFVSDFSLSCSKRGSQSERAASSEGARNSSESRSERQRRAGLDNMMSAQALISIKAPGKEAPRCQCSREADARKDNPRPPPPCRRCPELLSKGPHPHFSSIQGSRSVSPRDTLNCDSSS